MYHKDWGGKKTLTRVKFLISQLPPFSRPGTVRAPSLEILSHSGVPLATVPRKEPFCCGRHARGRVCKQPHKVVASSLPRVQCRNNVRHHITHTRMTGCETEEQHTHTFSLYSCQTETMYHNIFVSVVC